MVVFSKIKDKIVENVLEKFQKHPKKYGFVTVFMLLNILI